MLTAIWIIAAVLLALWSLSAWGLHALLVNGAGWATDLRPLIDDIPYGEVIERWIPGWRQMLSLALDFAQTALTWVGDSATLVAWLVWGAGALMLAGTAGVLSLIVVLLRPKAGAGSAGVTR